MSLGIMNVLSSVAISWVNTKAAPFGRMIAKKEYKTLDHTFFRALAQSLAVSVIFSLTAWSTLVLLNAHHLKIAGRMLPPLPFGLLLLAMVVNHTVFSVAIYLRSHKQEKMLGQSIYGAVGTALSTYFLGKRFGAIGVVSGYLVFVRNRTGNGSLHFSSLSACLAYADVTTEFRRRTRWGQELRFGW